MFKTQFLAAGLALGLICTLFSGCEPVTTFSSAPMPVLAPPDEEPVRGPIIPPDASTLSAKYPGDNWDRTDPALLFASNFESGTHSDWDSASSYTGDSYGVLANSSLAHSGQHSFRMAYTLTHLQSRGDASISLIKGFTLPPSATYYVRYYTRYENGTARPHHANGTRVYAPGYDQGGTAGIRPLGDQRFNTTVDLLPGGQHFFYTYWHEMRSWKCNDGSIVNGCAGDQGATSNLYYGNNLKPPNQTGIDMYQWNCFEYKVKANTPNQYDGELALWINNTLVGEFKTGTPMGQWLRENFYTERQYGTVPNTPFEGFNFRTSSAVNQVRVSLAFYQEWGTLSTRRTDTPTKAENQIVYYDDVAIATQRIGCRVSAQ